MRKMLVVFILALFGCLLDEGEAGAQDKWAMGTSGTGSGPYVWGASISKFLNKHQKEIRISAQATAGYNENVELVNAGKIEIGQQAGSGLVDAYAGEKAFKGRPHKRLRLLFPFVLAPGHLVTREAADIKTIQDLKGKKVNIGLPAQITRVENEGFLQVANIPLGEIKKFELATGESFTALRDGAIDATLNYYSVGHGALLELAIGTRVRLINIPDEIVEKMVEQRGGVVPFTIPPDTYKGQNYPVKTFSLTNVFFVRDDLPEEKVYRVTRTFWDNLSDLQKEAAFKHLTKNLAFSKASKVPYHPGALRYYKEIGLAK